MMRLKLKFNPNGLALGAEMVVTMIKERTADSRDSKGSPFRPYSKKPFAMPFGAIPTMTQRRLKSQKALKLFTTKKGQLWAVIFGGYAAYKKIRYPHHGGQVNLRATGNMMQNLTILKVSEKSILIGFSHHEQSKKAYYNEKNKRKFLGITEAEAQRLLAFLGKNVEVK